LIDFRTITSKARKMTRQTKFYIILIRIEIARGAILIALLIRVKIKKY
jgi:hypothetical protein